MYDYSTIAGRNSLKVDSLFFRIQVYLFRSLQSFISKKEVNISPSNSLPNTY